MKSFLALVSLLLSASPVFADDFVYLKCENKMTLISTEVGTEKLLNRETKSETVYFKIDPAGKRFTSYNPSSSQQVLKWNEAAVVGGALRASLSENNEALQVDGEIVVEFQPAGKLNSQVLAVAFGMISSDIDIVGDCVAVAESVFAEVLKESQN
ncbi:hypothetical protein [Synechococcus sp. UW140]|uniref:hypothetical protein n=1 Tax=Synechococcus sp. UW140 TaxID=368503 RepID=UPI0010BDE3D1|nr:hypothetical protein [Synechococcus sp. UW140]